MSRSESYLSFFGAVTCELDELLHTAILVDFSLVSESFPFSFLSLLHLVC